MFKIQGWVEQGNTLISTGGLLSTTKAQGSFPSVLVTVYIHGTVTLASLFSDDNVVPTPLANPFTSNSDGTFGFYASSGRYDLVFSGGDLPAPYTLDDVTNGAGGGTGDVVGPGVSVNNDFAQWDGVTGLLLKDGGYSPSSFVRGPISAVGNNIVIFDSTTGSLIKDSGQQISGLTGIMALIPSTCQGRLTLASGFPVYDPQPATPSSTDTGTEVVTFTTDPGWVTGTILTPVSTLAGLTTGTLYYYRRLSSVTGAFYTTLANANADTSRVNLSASVTQQLTPSGVTQTTLYFSPYNGNAIGLYSPSAVWNLISFTEISISLGTLASGRPYDVFCYDRSGVPTLELLAWTNTTTRATAITLQDGVPSKTGDTTRRLLGTIYTDSTTTTIDDAGGLATQVGGKRFVSNLYNVVQGHLKLFDSGSLSNYSTNTWRQADAATGNKVEAVACFPTQLSATGCSNAAASSSSVTPSVGMNIDSITATPFMVASANVTTAVGVMGLVATVSQQVAPGYHFAALMEKGNGSATSSFVTWSIFGSVQY